MSHGKPRHKKPHREKRQHVARPQPVPQPPIREPNFLAGMQPDEALLPPVADVFLRLGTSTNKLIEAIEVDRAQQRVLREVIESIS
jgi:hypothetical protein